MATTRAKRPLVKKEKRNAPPAFGQKTVERQVPADLREDLLTHPDTHTLEVGPLMIPWLLSAYTPRLVEAHGLDFGELLSTSIETLNLDALADLVWAGGLIFDENLSRAKIHVYITMKEGARLREIVAGDVLTYFTEFTEMMERYLPGLGKAQDDGAVKNGLTPKATNE